MVFIKFLKNIDKEKKIMFCLFVKVIHHQTVMVFEKTLFMFENQTLSNYFINYRKQFDGKYSLDQSITSLYQLSDQFNADIEVQIKDFSIEGQQEDYMKLEVLKGGKKIQLNVSKVQTVFSQQKSSVLIVQHPLCINFYLLYSGQFKQIMDLQFQDLIISFSIINNNQIIILNEHNNLEVYSIQFGILRSQKELLTRINLSQYDQMFFMITQQYIHGQRSVLQITDDEISEFLRYQEVKDSQPIDLEQLDDRMSDFRNMKVYQLAQDSWVFAYKQHELFAYSINSIYRILDKMTITSLVLSQFYYQKVNHVDEQDEEKQYLVQYQILIVAGMENEKMQDQYYVKAYQWLQSSELKCTILVPLLCILDLKNEIDYLEFLNQYDVIFKDVRGRVGIMQFQVEEFGQVLLQQN